MNDQSTFLVNKSILLQGIQNFRLAACRTAFNWCDLQISMNVLSMTSPHFTHRGMVWWSSQMWNAKVSAVIAAALFMYSVSAQAMEFADRPGMTVVRSMPTMQVTSDLARRQINQPKSLLGSDQKAMAILDSIFALLAEPEGPGRLSAEFSPVVADSGNFERRPIMIGSRMNDAIRRAAMRFEDRPHHAVTSKFVDQIVTSSVRKSKVPFGLHSRPSAAEFCVGSIAPCGPLNFAQRHLMQDS